MAAGQAHGLKPGTSSIRRIEGAMSPIMRMQISTQTHEVGLGRVDLEMDADFVTKDALETIIKQVFRVN